MAVFIMLYIAIGIMYWWLILVVVQKDVGPHKVECIPNWLLGFMTILTITLWPLLTVLSILKTVLSCIGFMMKKGGN